jgi:hypothetical protein
MPQPALAAFHDGGRFPGRRFLRHGFRHVLVAINDGRAWLVVDPRRDRIEIDASLPANFDLAEAWRQAGLVVIATSVTAPDTPARPLPLAPLSCVEVVKRVLGLRLAWVHTPYALYRHLSRS